MKLINQKGFTPIFLLLGILILTGIGLGVYFFSNQIKPNPLKSYEPPTNRINLKAITLSNLNIQDSHTELIFADENIIYKAKLDGSQPQAWIKMEDNVTALKFFPGKEDLFIETQRPVITGEKSLPKKIDPNTGQWIYKNFPLLESNTRHWIQRKDTVKPEILTLPTSNDGFPDYDIRDISNMTRPESIYTEKSSTGDIELFSEPITGAPAVKIGTILEKPLEMNNCGFEIDTKGAKACLEKYVPYAYYPSPDGNYLLNRPRPGGGLGEPGIVISRDGSKIYKIDFYWYGSWAVWIDDNKLLASDTGAVKLFTLNENGTFTKKELPNNISESYLTQSQLSPTKKLLSLGNLEFVDTEKLAKVSGPFDTKTNDNYSFISWNKDGTKLVAFNQPKKSIVIYDISTQKLTDLAFLNQEAPDWVKINRDTFGPGLFEIR